MKFVIILAVVAYVAAVPSDPKPNYSRYENFNVDEIIENDRLLSAYSKCFEKVGKCTPEGNDIQGWIPGAMKTNCEGCSEHQKTLVAKFLKAISVRLAEDWKKLDKLYNPDGKYTESTKQFIDKYANKQ